MCDLLLQGIAYLAVIAVLNVGAAVLVTSYCPRHARRWWSS